jgi:thymidine phosphorylase
VDAEALGRASTDLGAGRKRKGEAIDPAVGIVFRPKIGDRLETGEEIGTIHARDEAAASECAPRVLSALRVSQEPVEPPPLVHGWYGG